MAADTSEPAGYRELAPHALLRQHVECYWTARGPADAFVVLPDGCVDFHFDGGAARLVGAMTRAVEVPAERHRDVVAVRFRPGGAHAFVQAPLAEFTDEVVELACIARDLGDLGRRVDAHEDRSVRLRCLEAWLLARLPGRRDPIAEALAAASTAASFRVDRAAAAAGVSRQYFTRAVRTRSGLPPKALAKILRVRRVLADRSGATGALLAQRHGFADQPHLARDVRAVTGQPLSHWR